MAQWSCSRGSGEYNGWIMQKHQWHGEVLNVNMQDMAFDIQGIPCSVASPCS